MSDDDEALEGEVVRGIIFGLPVLVIQGDEETWVAPGNWFVGLFLVPYMDSWFYNDDSPIFVHDGSYWQGLIQWIFVSGDEGL